MNRFRKYLVESKKISLEEIHSIIKKGPTYVMIGGGIGSGKSTFAHNNFELNIVDVDEVANDIADGDLELARKKAAESMAIKNRRIEKYFKDKESFIETRTAANLNSTINKFTQAKDAGFNTIFILIDVPVEVSIKQNRDRIEKGGHGVPPEKEHKIQRVADGVANTFKNIKNNPNLDHYLVIKGKQSD